LRFYTILPEIRRGRRKGGADGKRGDPGADLLEMFERNHGEGEWRTAKKTNENKKENT